MVSTHSDCLACGSSHLDLLIDFGQMPLAGGFIRPDEIHLDVTYPLRLARCSNCTLLQILDIVPPEIIFSRYSYSSSTTRTLVDHFAQMGQELVRVADAVGKLVVEFGCNDGVLMQPLLNAGAKAVGVDPSDVAAQASKQQGWPLFNNYFNKTIASQVKAEYGAARIVTGNNVFAHTDDLHAILDGVTELLDDVGLFVFEVHYQGDLINLVQFDTFYHEHICYHSLKSLAWLLAEHGLKIINVLRIPIHAGSVRVTAARSDACHDVSPVVAEMMAAEKNLDCDRFVQQVDVRRATLKKLVEDLNQAGQRVVGYGAAGRSTTLLNYCGLGPAQVEYVLDMSPLRYGRLVPGVRIPVVEPKVFYDTYPDYALLTAWNYEEEIVAKEQTFLEGGHFIVPLPEIRVIGAI